MKENNAPLKGVIKNIIEKLEKEAEDDVVSVCKKAVGKNFENYINPVSFNRGKLILNVSDSSRLYELTLRRKEIIESINKSFKRKKAKEIRFKIGEI